MTWLDRIAFAFTWLVLMGLAAAVIWAGLWLWPVLLALTGH
jgi:hypothetical protein